MQRFYKENEASVRCGEGHSDGFVVVVYDPRVSATSCVSMELNFEKSKSYALKT